MDRDDQTAIDEQRENALDVFLVKQTLRGFRIETRTETHAIIAPVGWRSWFRTDRGRLVVSVDADGKVKTSSAVPVRS